MGNSPLPSHWLLLFEAGAALLVLLAAGSALLVAPGRRLRRLLSRLAATPGRTLLAMALIAFGVTALSYLVWGPPIAKVTDEYGHLLVADTLLHGRLANPSHPMWRHFDIYALQFPSYASKYPPGQGLLLALGGLFGAVSLGPCLGAGLLAAAMGWAFFRWLPPRWAVIGTLLVLLRLAIGSYWHQSYWGGTVAAVAGALLFGALAPRRQLRPGLAALGLAGLALSRPFEGLLVALPALWFLALHFRNAARRSLPQVRREMALLLLVLLPTAAFLAYSNWRITGDPLLFPQAGYATAYGGTPDLVFQRSYEEFAGQQQRAPIRASRLAHELSALPRAAWLLEAFAAVPARLVRSLFFYLGIAGSLVFLLGLARAGKREALPVAALVIGTLGQGLPSFYFPHHASPLTFVFWLLSLEGLRRAALARWPAGPAKGRRPGFRLALLLLLAELLATTLRFPTLRPEASDWSRQRAAMATQLEAIPGRHLVIVQPRSATDWVYNGADIDGSRIVWARTLDADNDRLLRAYFGDRQAWRVRLEVEPPVLEPWQPAPASKAPATTGPLP